MRLGTWLPFGPAARLLAHFTGVPVSEATACRLTEAAGAAYVAVQTAAVDALERALPAAPPGPAVQQLSVDGAMVPLVHREWAEVKTLAVGTVAAGRAQDLSYFSRLADAAAFGRLATVETHRRGTETAGTVVAVVDGADWAQGFIDLHRPDAVRVLDWAHAAEHLGAAAQARFGEGSPQAAQWLEAHLTELKEGEPQRVLDALRDLCADPATPPPATLATVSGSLAYLEQRLAQIQYAAFTARGYPIGSGAVESANKLVVEARLKGAGMHWARPHVDPLVALRTLACADRWAEAWPQILAQQRRQVHDRARARHAARAPAAALAPPPPPPPLPPAPAVRAETARRPPATHPWKRPWAATLRRQQADAKTHAET